MYLVMRCKECKGPGKDYPTEGEGANVQPQYIELQTDGTGWRHGKAYPPMPKSPIGRKDGIKVRKASVSTLG